MADNVTLTFQNPLTEQHLRDINAALDGIKVGLQQVNLAKRAGIDVSAQEAALKDTEKRLLAVRQVYFPGR